MVEAAITVSSARGAGHRSSAELSRSASDMLRSRCDCSPDVPEVLAEVGARPPPAADHQGRPHPPDAQGHDQRARPTTSSTSRSCSRRIPTTYRRILRTLGVEPDRFCMVGNSVRSDILPVLAIGGTRGARAVPRCCGTSSTSPITASSSPSSHRSPTSPAGCAGRHDCRHLTAAARRSELAQLDLA